MDMLWDFELVTCFCYNKRTRCASIPSDMAMTMMASGIQNMAHVSCLFTFQWYRPNGILLQWLSTKVSILRAGDWGFKPTFTLWVIPLTLVATLSNVGVVGTVPGLVGQVSANCDWVKEQVWFAASDCGSRNNCLSRFVHEVVLAYLFLKPQATPKQRANYMKFDCCFCFMLLAHQASN